jgi:hypothetical protein
VFDNFKRIGSLKPLCLGRLRFGSNLKNTRVHHNNAVNASVTGETTFHGVKMLCRAALISPRIILAMRDRRLRSDGHREKFGESYNEPAPHPQNQRRCAGSSLAQHHTPAVNHLKSWSFRWAVEPAFAALVKQSAGLPGKRLLKPNTAPWASGLL